MMLKKKASRWLVMGSLLASLGPVMARADETDWLYFPMYERDTAHAVDLRALQWRPDGLLASGTRYPRHSDAPWTEEQSKRGWYEYEKRLIDCRLGFYVSTEIRLLDADGQVIASRPYDPTQWVESLTRQLGESGSKAWPQQDEILLACAAASQPALKAQRAQKARSSQALISYAPMTRELTSQSAALMKVAQQRYDLEALRAHPPATVEALFDRLRQQHAAWQKSIAGPSSVSVELPAPRRTELERRLSEALLALSQGQLTSPHVLPDGVLEFSSPLAFGEEPPDLSPGDQTRVGQRSRVLVTQRLDCRSGAQVRVSASWRDAQGDELLTKPFSVKAALGAAGMRDPLAWWDLRWGPWSDVTQGSVVCRMLARLSADPSLGKGVDVDTLPPVDLTPERLAQEKTPEAMLLAIRAAWRARRPVY